MHMADALLSPEVGGVMWAASGASMAIAVKGLAARADDRRIPLMGVLGAFVFAAQMINFAIPGTGSSGHLGGALLLAALLGPYAAFLVMASILAVQAFFFADGGLLALGANIFNLAFYTCFIVYPLVFRPLARRAGSRAGTVWASVLAGVIGLQLGALSVVTQTVLSGRTELPFGPFVLLMQPIHLAIGVVEGLVTAAVLLYVRRLRPQLLESQPYCGPSLRTVIASLAVLTLIGGGVVSWFASSRPDGLEWSIERTTGTGELEAESATHTAAAKIQGRTAILPDYELRGGGDAEAEVGAWPAVNTGTTLSGVLGALLTLALGAGAGALVRLLRRQRSRAGG